MMQRIVRNGQPGETEMQKDSYRSVEPKVHRKIIEVVHEKDRKNKLKPTVKPKSKSGRCMVEDANCDDEYVVDKILAKRLNPVKRSYEYLLKWQGYGHESNTWEPIDSVSKCKSLLEEFERNLAKQKAMRAMRAIWTPQKTFIEVENVNPGHSFASQAVIPIFSSETKVMDQVQQWCGPMENEEGERIRPGVTDDQRTSQVRPILPKATLGQNTQSNLINLSGNPSSFRTNTSRLTAPRQVLQKPLVVQSSASVSSPTAQMKPKISVTPSCLMTKPSPVHNKPVSKGYGLLASACTSAIRGRPSEETAVENQAIKPQKSKLAEGLHMEFQEVNSEKSGSEKESKVPFPDAVPQLERSQRNFTASSLTGRIIRLDGEPVKQPEPEPRESAPSTPGQILSSADNPDNVATSVTTAEIVLPSLVGLTKGMMRAEMIPGVASDTMVETSESESMSLSSDVAMSYLDDTVPETCADITPSKRKSWKETVAATLTSTRTSPATSEVVQPEEKISTEKKEDETTNFVTITGNDVYQVAGQAEGGQTLFDGSDGEQLCPDVPADSQEVGSVLGFDHDIAEALAQLLPDQSNLESQFYVKEEEAGESTENNEIDNFMSVVDNSNAITIAGAQDDSGQVVAQVVQTDDHTPGLCFVKKRKMAQETTSLLNCEWFIDKTNIVQLQYSSPSKFVADASTALLEVSKLCYREQLLYIAYTYEQQAGCCEYETPIEEDILSVHLFLKPSSMIGCFNKSEKPKDFKLTFSIEDDAKNSLYSKEKMYTVMEQKESKFGFCNFISYRNMYQLFNNDGATTINCKLETVPEIFSSTKSNIQQSFKSLLKNESLSDVTLNVKDKLKIPAHKLILYARSSYFEKMFSRKNLENSDNEVKVNFEPEPFMEVLKYMYCQEVDNLDTLAIEIYKIAHYYQIEHLQMICKDFLKNNLMNAKNVFEVLELTEDYKELELQNHCIKLFIQNFKVFNVKQKVLKELFKSRPNLSYKLFSYQQSLLSGK